MTTTDVYRALWRHKAFIVLMTSAVIAAVAFLTSRQTPVYEAHTRVHIFPPLTDSVDPAQAADIGERLAQTYAEAVQTTAIATKVYQQLNGDIPLGAIEGKISAEPANGLEFMTISVRNRNPDNAQRIANEVPPALKSYIAQFENLRGLEVSVVDPAVRPSEPASPNMRLNIILALLFGLIFNAALALLVEALGDRFHDTEELEELTGQPVLATVPSLKFGLPQSFAAYEMTRTQASEPVVEVRS